MVEVIKQFGWDFILVVYMENFYGKFVIKIFFENIFVNKKICIIFILFMKMDVILVDVKMVIDNLNQRVGVRVIVLFVIVSYVRFLL